MNPSLNHSHPPRHIGVAVIGGGQAGLSISWHLKQRGIDHRVFEKHRVAHEWRHARWDSFCLVTPNWQCRLPGFPYSGDDPHGFMLRHQIVEYLEAYVARFGPPLLEGVSVERLRPAGNAGFELATTAGDYLADQVVIATGGYHRPVVPRCAERLPASILQMHSSDYRNPQSMPEGAILVVGTGQSGCQIAEDLHLAGRKLLLSVGSAPRSPRRYRGRDVTEWLTDSGYYAITLDQHPQKETVREKTNHYLSGRGGGREIDLRRFALEGMRLYGRFRDVSGTKLRFEPDLRRNLDAADASAENIRQTIDRYIAEAGIDAPVEAPYAPPWTPEREITEIDLAAENIGSIIWCTGFSTDYRWAEVPAFDGRGQPVQRRGVSPLPGLYFLGLPWMHTWGSGRFADVGDDAAYLAGHIAQDLASTEKPHLANAAAACGLRR